VCERMIDLTGFEFGENKIGLIDAMIDVVWGDGCFTVWYDLCCIVVSANGRDMCIEADE